MDQMGQIRRRLANILDDEVKPLFREGMVVALIVTDPKDAKVSLLIGDASIPTLHAVLDDLAATGNFRGPDV